MPLNLAPRNTEMKISRVSAEEKTKRHLNELGITEGGTITLVSSTSNGVIVIVKEGRLCLDGRLARSIMVA